MIFFSLSQELKNKSVSPLNVLKIYAKIYANLYIGCNTWGLCKVTGKSLTILKWTYIYTFQLSHLLLMS